MNVNACAKILAVAVLTLVANPSALGLERLEPPTGCYLGVSMDNGDTIDRLNSRLGLRPAVYCEFFEFPLPPALRPGLTNFLDQVRTNGGIAMITLEPYGGLTNVSAAACLEFAQLCSRQETQGISGIMVRFAHEMNGPWNPWGQQPVPYKEKFRLVAQHIRTNTTRTAMLWAPSYGGGYPFGANVTPASPHFAALDTDGDGTLTQNDDSYEPYYPGDDVMDWVGLTLYHWGIQWPWLENELPETNNFATRLTGNYLGGNGDERSVPDFYARYCADGVRNKPLAIPETAAFSNPHHGGAGNMAIKQAWWRQVFNISGDTPEAVDVALHFPKLKCITWFDHYKLEGEQAEWIDWRISAPPPVRSAFVQHVRTLRNGEPYFLTAQDLPCEQSVYCVRALDLPALLPVTGLITASFIVRSPTPAALHVGLLDENGGRCGGAVALITNANQTVTLTFPLQHRLADGATYRWGISLLPTDVNQTGPLAVCDAVAPVARALTPSTQIVGHPAALTNGSNFTVKVHYTAAEPAVVQVNLLDGNYNWHGGGTVPVTRGEGALDVTVELPWGVTNGNYMLEGFLSNASTNWQNPMARSQNFPARVETTISQNSVQALAHPAVVPAGEVFRFIVNYSAMSNADIHVDFFDAQTNFLAGNLQPVAAGSGFREMTISHPTALPGNYFVSTFLTPPGLTWTHALAWSAEQRITVVSADYWRWCEAHWGVLLENDFIHPAQDADGDGASNDSERIAGTAPLDVSDVLRLNTSMSGGQLILSWRSAVSRAYQLFETVAAASNSWTPVGPSIAGTGETLQVPITPGITGARKFYRLHVLP
jgi:hypothetical protein